MNTLEETLTEYLALRRSVGYKLVSHEYLLRSFVAFCSQQNAETITTALALTWAVLPRDASRAWWGQRLCAVRGFAAFIATFDPLTQVPDSSWLPNATRRIAPYIYSDEEVGRLMQMALELRPEFRAHTYTTIVGLLAATGLRIGEVLALDVGSIDLANSLIVVTHSKLDAAREVPVSDSTTRALAAFIAARESLGDMANQNALFVNLSGARLNYASVRNAFSRLLAAAQITADDRRAPRLHDLRHRFAVRTLSDLYATSLDARASLVALSTYLGHVDPSSTYWYLEATPELLRGAARRLELAGGPS